MAGSGVIDGAKDVANKMAMGLINAIAGTRAANSGSVDCVADDFPRSSKGGKCPPHLLKKRTDKEAGNESVTSNEEVGVVKK
ncbi:hypothetical protein J7T55_007291 [Diaporthe amygdali]|uniref:uncharacterized protein n=1 Tax=Phomopsis amygdali TaxID=1214568 RepID=UPI0022FE8841|nr:uncharacterized protein J7T55_007291 [Diaporthe amygdali]KAJ0116314.1 hypothetical protein J7T55_007291 [Diaporthe amygdali]